MNFFVISPYVFNTSLTWYSVFVLLGALAAYGMSEYFYRKNPESKKCPDLLFNTFLIAFPAGLIGARIWYVLSDWADYMADPISILKVWEGGLAVQGGVLLGVVAGVSYVIHKSRKVGLNLSINKIMDFVIPNILLAQAIGRWGNFFNREVYGSCTSKENLWFLPSFILDQMEGEGFRLSGKPRGPIACQVGEYAQPLFLYEGLLNIVGFVLITFVLRKWFKKRIDGTLTGLYLVWYGTVRACLEGLRYEEFIMKWGNLSQSVITSIIYIILGAGFIIYLYIDNYRKKQVIKESTNENIAMEVSEVTEEKIEIKQDSNEVESNEENVKKEKSTKSNTSKNGNKKTTTKKTSNENNKSNVTKKAGRQTTKNSKDN